MRKEDISSSDQEKKKNQKKNDLNNENNNNKKNLLKIFEIEGPQIKQKTNFSQQITQLHRPSPIKKQLIMVTYLYTILLKKKMGSF